MAPNVQSVLVVEDEASIASFVSLYLKNAGYDVTTAATGAEALAAAEREQPALIVLDLMLPDIDGIEICRRMRQKSDVPILMLTARDESENRIKGLEIGADDYLAKPFEPRELLLRINNILKRQRKAPATESVKFGEFIFHLGRSELRRGETVVHLTDRERELLGALAGAPGETVTRLALASTGAGTNERAVDVQINRLRRKLERDPANPLFVQTVRGIGYRLMIAP
jgi:two-component system, OmpR family, phosphate regulon response regulator OmpR